MSCDDDSIGWMDVNMNEGISSSNYRLFVGLIFLVYLDQFYRLYSSAKPGEGGQWVLRLPLRTPLNMVSEQSLKYRFSIVSW